MQRVIVGVFLLVFVLGCKSERETPRSTKRLPGAWQATPIVVDGKRNDWPIPYPFDNSKAQVTYAITNDKDNLYISLETGDPATELKILRRGLVVWVDRSATKTQRTSVCFPSDNEHGQLRIAPGRDLIKQIDEAMASTNEFFLNGFKGCHGKFSLKDGDTCGISVGVGLDEYDQLIWEAVIPFKTFYPKAQIDSRDAGKPIDICFDILGMEKPEGMGNGGGAPRVGFGLGGGMGMGGMGMGLNTGGGGRGGGAINDQLYRTTSFWQEVGIAYQQ